MSNKLSPVLTNINTSPVVINDAVNAGDRQRVKHGIIPLATADLDTSDTILLDRVPTNAKIQSINLAATDVDTNATPTAALDVGVYADNLSTITAKNATIYAAAQTTPLQAGSAAWLDFEKRTADKKNQRVWEDAGDTTDPGGYYIIGLKLSTGAATAATGTLAYKIEYVI